MTEVAHIHVDQTQDFESLMAVHDEALGLEKRGDRKIERLRARESGDSMGKAKQEHALAYEASEESESTRPLLAQPSERGASFWGFGDPSNVPLIAIISQTMALEMKTQSDFWSTTFRIASQEMSTFASQIDPTCKATVASFNQMSEATKCDAKIDRAMGWASCIAGLGAAAMGGMQGWKDAGKEIAEASAKEASAAMGAEKLGAKEAGKLAESAVSKEASSLGQAAEKDALSVAKKDGANIVEKGVADSEKGLTDGAKQLEKSPSKLKTFKNCMTYVSNIGFKFSQMQMGLSATSTGITQLTKTCGLKEDQADAQRLQGEAQSDKTRSEMTSQYHQMAFEREDGFRQGSQQFIDLAYNLVISAADSLSQTSRSMFQG